MERRPENTLILTEEPFVGLMPGEVRQWLQEHREDAALASALAAVSNQTGRLGYELDEVDDPWLDYAYEEWWELEKELYERILSEMQAANQRGDAHYNMHQQGLHYIVKPFMERNGFADGSGWWSRKQKDEDSGYL